MLAVFLLAGVFGELFVQSILHKLAPVQHTLTEKDCLLIC